MTSHPTGRDKLYWLINLYLEDHHDIRTFCKEFERAYNFEVEKRDLSAREQVVFESLFRKVVMFSPFEDELKTIPMYVSVSEIKDAAIAARDSLRVQ